MWLIAGLGNPGRRYQGTRHNIGFEVLDELLRRHMQGAYRSKFGGEYATGLIGTTKAILFKPMEFMNNSGIPLQKVAQFHDVSPENILVVHDELDLPPAKLRLKSGGGHGGNNGLRSIVAQFATKDFQRIRVGIGKPLKSDGNPGEGSGANYVLAPFAAHEKSTIEDAVRLAADAAETVVASGIIQAMNDFNGVNPS